MERFPAPGRESNDEPVEDRGGLEAHAIGNLPPEGHCAFMVGFCGFGDCSQVAPPHPTSGPVSCSQLYRVVYEKDGKIFLRTQDTGGRWIVRLAKRNNSADLVNSWVWNRLMNEMMTAIRDDESGGLCLDCTGGVEN